MCASVMPGITVRLRSSTIVAPGGAVKPLSMRVMRPLSTITVEAPRAGCAASTISRPAWIAYVSAPALVAVTSAAAPASRCLNMEVPSPGRNRGLARFAAASSYQGLERRNSVGFIGGLVGADAADPREAHGEPRLVAGAFVNRIERDFEHQGLLDLAHRPEALDGVAANPAVEPLQLLVGEAEIGLADGKQLVRVGP